MARLKSAFTDLPDAPYPDLLDHERFTAYMKTPHDVGGEPDAPIKFENAGRWYRGQRRDCGAPDARPA
jgi:thiocyanate hydrolase subunit alpha/thiocyanate hydrolase subunit beta